MECILKWILLGAGVRNAE